MQLTEGNYVNNFYVSCYIVVDFYRLYQKGCWSFKFTSVIDF